MLIDTHCHIHESTYPLEIGETLARATEAGVTKIIAVGTSLVSSREAIDFAEANNQFASIGVHPHDSKDGYDIGALVSPKVVAIGEIGLDYFYTHSPREVQIEALNSQLELAQKHNLPVIFHVRDAFDDFWPIFDSYPGIRGVLHSFTDNKAHLHEALKRGLYIGLNGISTFTKDESQKETFDAVPIDRLLFETDAPFLTPSPFRGKVNEPAFVRNIAQYHAERRGISVDEIAKATSANAHTLFAL